MHYYQFNIGDYSSHTSRLSLLEDLAYRRLLDLYYLNERPFNECSTDVARDIGMIDHVAEVGYILDKYFTKIDGKRVNKRADKEIKAYQDKKKSASKAGKASAKARQSAKPEQAFNDRSTTVQPNIKHKPLNIKQEPKKEIVKKPQSFKDFFELYPPNKKGGTDATAWKKAKTLNLSDQDFLLMVDDLARRKAQMPEWYSTYATGITKYLSESIWLTPVVPEQANGQSQQPSRKLSHADEMREQAKRFMAERNTEDTGHGGLVIHQDGNVVQGEVKGLPDL